MINFKYRIHFLLAVFLVPLVVLAVFYWNEARKEVVFLCGNFGDGVTRSSVQKQLDTGNLLRYHTEETPVGQRIVVDSSLNFGVYRCVIEFDDNDKVLRAKIS